MLTARDWSVRGKEMGKGFDIIQAEAIENHFTTNFSGRGRNLNSNSPMKKDIISIGLVFSIRPKV